VEIKYSRDAIKFLSKLDKKSAERIRNAISKLASSSPQGDIATMQGYDDNRKRLRIGGWRVIFRYNKHNCIEVLFVINIGNRGDIYK